MEQYYTEFAGAFVRGRLGDAATLEDGRSAGLHLHKFKAHTELPRVQRVLATLRGLCPANLLDIGSGRGTFLWPLMAAFPQLPVTSIDTSASRSADIAAVRKGGVERLRVARMDAHHLAFGSHSFDVVTFLEVLEHLDNPQSALRGAITVARRFVLLSVPSVPDDNPEHLRLFSPDQLYEMAAQCGSARTTIEHVLNHRIVVIRVRP